MCLCTVYGCFHTNMAELSYDRDKKPAKPKIFAIQSFMEKVCQSLLQTNGDL